MNIFYTDRSPIQCAKYLCDKRTNKMILETAQMLSTACRVHGFNNDQLYKIAHLNHPSSIWVRKTKSNYIWAYRHFTALGREKIRRTGRSHKSYETLRELFLKGLKYIPEGPLTPIPNCAANKSLDISYKHIADTCLAYQMYLSERWDNDKRTPTWYGIKR